ncbi:hypothetical protein NQ318_006152, partial [Aromia moschata]
ALFKCGSIILYFLCHLKHIETAPTKSADTFNFEDDWDYKIEPHSVPLLTVSTKNHQLPSSYTYAEDLNVEGIVRQENTARTLRGWLKKLETFRLNCAAVHKVFTHLNANNRLKLWENEYENT